MSWDAFQREMLDALGHRVYRLAGAEQGGPGSAVQADVGELTPLQRSVLRAAGLRDPDASLLAAARGLRADPAAKRALWPRLRTLRRGEDG